MIPFQRPHVGDLVRLLTDDRVRPRIVAITGPRQSGKTTIVRQALRRVRAAGLAGERIAVDNPEGTAGLSSPRTGTAVVPDPPGPAHHLSTPPASAREASVTFRPGRPGRRYLTGTSTTLRRQS